MRLINYTLITAFSRENHIKGGVAIYKHDSFGYEVESTNLEDLSTELTCEMTAVKIKLEQKIQLYAIGIYRPPNSSFDYALQSMANLLDQIPQENGGICLVGDLNVDWMDKSKKRENQVLNECLSSYNMSRILLPPTRITSTSVSSIDVVCTNLDHGMLNVDVLHLGLSDHTGQLTTLDIPSKRKITPSVARRRLNKNNLSCLRDLLEIQSWERVYRATDVDDAYTNFVDTFTTALDITCPIRISRDKPKKQHNPAVCPEAAALKVRFLEAHDKFIRTNKEQDKEEACQRKKSYDLKLKELRKRENEARIKEAPNKSKAIWEVINSERTTRKKGTECSWQLEHVDGVTDDITLVAELFNTFFTTTAEELLKRNNQTMPKTFQNIALCNHNLKFFPPATTEEVKKSIKSLKLSSSAGVDGISSKMLKFCENELSHPLTNIINKSMAQGHFPTKMKISKVYPLHKNGSKSKTQNFRPISLVPTVSKLLEKIVLTRLFNHLVSYNLLPVRQHGFLAGKSTTTALTELIELITDYIEKGNTVTGTFLDLSKAFDSLDHTLLLSKISSLGISELALKWFKSYLTNRTQIVEVKQTINEETKVGTSTPLPVRRGVPQGSVLGPILFLLFTRDLPLAVEPQSSSIMYADDTVLVSKSKSLETLEINTFVSVSKAEQYCVQNDLVFNEAKTKLLALGRNKDQLSGFPNITTVQAVKHLGMVLDDRLSWNDHVDNMCLRLGTSLFALQRVRAISTPEALRTAYHALFESHIRYGIILWGGSSAQNLQRALVLQKRAIRTVTGLQQRDSCREAFKTLGILTVTSLYILEVILHTSNVDLLKHNNIHEHNTRHADDFVLPSHRTALFEQKPSYAGVKLYNALPNNIKRGNNGSFKGRLRGWLLERSIYNLNEFFACTGNLNLYPG